MALKFFTSIFLHRRLCHGKFGNIAIINDGVICRENNVFSRLLVYFESGSAKKVQFVLRNYILHYYLTITEV